MGKPAFLQLVAQRIRHMRLPGNIGKHLRAPFPVKHLIHGNHSFPACDAFPKEKAKRTVHLVMQRTGRLWRTVLTA